MKLSKVFLVIFTLALLSGCTATNTLIISEMEADQEELIISTGDIDMEYRSLGITQVSVTGMWLFGYIELMPAQLQKAIAEELSIEAKKYGADAVINIDFYEMQYPPLIKFLSIFAILSPQYAFVTGEMVEFTK